MNNDSNVCVLNDRHGHSCLVDEADKDALILSWNYNKVTKYFSRSSSTRKLTRPTKRRSSTVYLHRIILQRKLNRVLLPNEFTDHIDGDRLNNTRSNLRVVSKSTNAANCKSHKDSRSIYKGVSRHSQKPKFWCVKIHSYSGGLYLDEITAAKAYDECAMIFFGHYARLNFPADWENSILKRDSVLKPNVANRLLSYKYS